MCIAAGVEKKTMAEMLKGHQDMQTNSAVTDRHKYKYYIKLILYLYLCFSVTAVFDCMPWCPFSISAIRFSLHLPLYMF